MRLSKIIIFLLPLIIISCSKRENLVGKNIIKEEFSTDDTFRVFYENGKLEYEAPSKNENRHGTCKWYYPSGKLKLCSEYKNGIQQGNTFNYYPNGKLEISSCYYDNKPFGHAYFFYPNGGIRSYISYDFEGNARYIRKYNENGTIVKDVGCALGQLFVFEFDSLVLLFVYARPPATTIDVFSKIYIRDYVYKIDNPLIEKTGKLTFPSSDLISKVLIIGTLRDSITNKIITRDSLCFPPVPRSLSK